MVLMKELNIGKDARIRLEIIDNNLVELYYSAVEEERHRILSVIRQLLQEKDAQSDAIAVSVLDWVLDRLTSQ